ncbi:MAG: hypothetical protein V7746_02775 [Halioglobus sp.]
MNTKSVPLQENEAQLKEEIERLLLAIREKWDVDQPTEEDQMDQLGAKALELHLSLAGHGREVKHHKYMLENRGTPVDDPEFYQHVHPVEDLLAFIDNVHANDDPEDTTQDIELRCSFYSRRWDRPDAYYFSRSETGWNIRCLEQKISTGPDGRIGGTPGSGLFTLLDHDSINYPEDLPGYFEWLWYQAAEHGLTVDQLREAIESISDWVSTVERSSPSGLFAGYK